MSGRWLGRLVVFVYLVIGGFIAWDHGYLSLAWLRVLASAVLAILLWWLVLLGVNLHIHAYRNTLRGGAAPPATPRLPERRCPTRVGATRPHALRPPGED